MYNKHLQDRSIAVAQTESATASRFTNYSDSEVWAKFKSGDRAAFIYIYNLYFDRLYAYSHQFTYDTALIKDCIQELFIRIDKSKTNLSNTSSIKLYLYKAIKRDVIRALKDKRNLAVQQEEYPGFNFGIELSIEEQIINRQISKDQLEALRGAVTNLTGRQREIIFYHFYEGFSLDQIKKLMDFRSEKATQNLLYRALKELRLMLAS